MHLSDLRWIIGVSHLPTSLTSPIYSGMQLIMVQSCCCRRTTICTHCRQGVALNFGIQPSLNDPKLLFPALACAVVALICLSKSEPDDPEEGSLTYSMSRAPSQYTRESSQTFANSVAFGKSYRPKLIISTRSSRRTRRSRPSRPSVELESFPDPNLLSVGAALQVKGTEIDLDEQYESNTDDVEFTLDLDNIPLASKEVTPRPLEFVERTEPIKRYKPKAKKVNPKREHRKWVAIIFIGGALASLWSPGSTLGARGPNGVQDLYALLLLYCFGQLLALPLGIYSAYRLGQLPPLTFFEIMAFSVSEAWQLPLTDKLWGMLTGLLLNLGLFCFYLATITLSAATATGISNCSPLLAMFIGVIIFHELHGARTMRKLLVSFSILFYVGAIVLLAVSNTSD